MPALPLGSDRGGMNTSTPRRRPSRRPWGAKTSTKNTCRRTTLVLVVSGIVSALVGCATSSGADEADAAATPGPGPLRVVALGDSISTTNACSGCTSFVDLYADGLARRTGRPVKARNLSIPGGVTADLRQQVTTDRAVQKELRRADVVTITIGYNETPWGALEDPCHVAPNFPVVDWTGLTEDCMRGVAHAFQVNLDGLLDDIEDVTAPNRPAFRLTTVYNTVIGEPVDPGWNSPEAVEPSVFGNHLFAEAQCEVAADHGGACARMLPLMNGPTEHDDAAPFLADHTHMNQVGHRLTADTLLALRPRDF